MTRAGAPDSLDRIVAVLFGRLAVQKVERGVHGVMLAVRDGTYTTVPIETCTEGEKRVDVGEFYDEENYRPRVAQVMGKPMFLY